VKIVIDLHCHVLPGIDDGPATIEASVALARAAVAAGTETLVATPHVSWRYPNDDETIAQLVDELRERLAVEGVAVELRPGAEIAMTRLIDMDEAQVRLLGLSGGPWLLVEPPFTPLATGVDKMVHDLQNQGHRIVLAHPERCPTFQRDPRMLESLVRGGVLTSVTAGALVGRFGASVHRFALELVRADMVHNVASDAHDTDKRGPGIAAELKQAGLDPLIDWLTRAVPAAILNGEETVPPRPVVEISPTGRRPRPWWRRRLLRQAS
jgi:protein-tyrosine phosphatase